MTAGGSLDTELDKAENFNIMSMLYAVRDVPLSVSGYRHLTGDMMQLAPPPYISRSSGENNGFCYAKLLGGRNMEQKYVCTYPSFKSRPLLNGVATGLGPVHAASILWAMDSQSREIERCRP
ncbi:hypothetical protein RRG08_011973 [Elysia crispata]|uniref:Uncharacterized protein n=1 Tax=Elysia crispata TaxID=231223 RepID=A0AAE0ZHH3_9GAST|nr:hypothetical protein RRG08_011973 [Elysia crispata]